MPEGDRTEFSTPIPLRGNGFDAAGAEMPNPYTRLEALAAARERLQQFAEHIHDQWQTLDGPTVAHVLMRRADELREAIWGDLAACERIRHRVPLGQLQTVWDDELDPAGPM